MREELRITVRDVEIAQNEIMEKLGTAYTNPAWPFAMISIGTATLLQNGIDAGGVLTIVRRLMTGIDHARLGLSGQVTQSLRKLEQES